MQSEEGETPKHKVTLLGSSGVGKTCLVVRIHLGTFQSQPPSTIGSGCINHTLETSSGKMKLQIWDTAGQERFKSLLPLYSRGTSVGIFVYSIADRDSFTNLGEWIKIFRDSAGEETKGIIVGSKMDLAENRRVTFEEGQEYANSQHMSFFEVSAKTSENLNVLCDEIGNLLASMQPVEESHLESKQSKCC